MTEKKNRCEYKIINGIPAFLCRAKFDGSNCEYFCLDCFKDGHMECNNKKARWECFDRPVFHFGEGMTVTAIGETEDGRAVIAIGIYPHEKKPGEDISMEVGNEYTNINLSFSCKSAMDTFRCVLDSAEKLLSEERRGI